MVLFWKKKHLLNWQKIVIINSPKDQLICSENMLLELTNQMVENDVRIIRESIGIIRTTSNEETKLSRQQVLRKRTEHLESLQPFIKNRNSRLIANAKHYY